MADYPPALFNADGLMRPSGKNKFSNYLCDTWGKSSIVEEATLTNPNPVIVYDGGMLIQNLTSLWTRGKTLGGIANEYVSHLTRQSRDSQEIIVVFDGYEEETPKGYIQRQRNPTKTLDFVVQDGTVLDLEATVFLTNPSNKQGFINLLSDKINAKPRLTAKKCTGDADRPIVETALETLKLHKPVLLKADDTDVLVMCLAESQTTGLYLKRGGKLYNVESFQFKIEPSVVRQNLLVLHGFFGCDCTSAFFYHPSYTALTKNWDHFSRDLAVFRDKKATIPDIHTAGIRLVAAMYGCDTDLNGERAQIFMDLCNDKKRKRKVTLDRLPPTADAVGLHAQRSYLQIQEWSGNSLRPESYGWKKVDGILEPIPMGQEPAPPFLMEVKKCGCTSGCRNRICRCVADGLACTDKCSCGETCENPKNSENNDDADDEVFDDALSESSDEERD